ncbi:MAG: hypothetical protein DHS20C15_10290 [Planctomycetota bacterium]|nr:MAG: hypothetical protein DHS20C15_10290 [Planctomycetota bacterium]
MTLVAGLDEAGYGPLLGPLVVAAAAYRLNDGVDESALNDLVRDTAVLEHGLPTADSKALYHSGGSIARIELSTLGHLHLLHGSAPDTLGGLLEHSVDPCLEEFDALPWYHEALAARPLPSVTTQQLIAERAAWHAENLAQRGAQIADLVLAPVPVPRFNAITTPAGSKAHTLFETTARLIRHLVDTHPDEELVIHVDRQGGRIHYGEPLSRAFPMAPLTTLHERTQESAYRLAWPGRAPVHIDFRVKADDERAPVALASVAAKTLRELCMGVLNTWFTKQIPGLAPSAGYGRDAQRFLLAVDRSVLESGATRDDFVRCR